MRKKKTWSSTRIHCCVHEFHLYWIQEKPLKQKNTHTIKPFFTVIVIALNSYIQLAKFTSFNRYCSPQPTVVSISSHDRNCDSHKSAESEKNHPRILFRHHFPMVLPRVFPATPGLGSSSAGLQYHWGTTSLLAKWFQQLHGEDVLISGENHGKTERIHQQKGWYNDL